MSSTFRREIMRRSPGKKFWLALQKEKPLQLVGAVNAYAALMAEKAGFKALYLSGAGVANISYGLPDLGMTTLDNVLEDVQRITNATELPLLVDIDTGWGNAFMISRAIRLLEKAGAAGVHIEDQVFTKRCGHRQGKALVDKSEMVDRIQAAVDAKTDPDFVIMARTDAYAIEGMDASIERALAYRDAGSDMCFPEALPDLKQFKIFKEALNQPVLANMTEFGKTPLYTTQELAEAKVDIALYPLSASRAMNAAAMKVYQDIRNNGSQADSLGSMQTREQLYEILQYDEYEKQADHLLM